MNIDCYSLRNQWSKGTLSHWFRNRLVSLATALLKMKEKKLKQVCCSSATGFTADMPTTLLTNPNWTERDLFSANAGVGTWRLMSKAQHVAQTTGQVYTQADEGRSVYHTR